MPESRLNIAVISDDPDRLFFEHFPYTSFTHDSEIPDPDIFSLIIADVSVSSSGEALRCIADRSQDVCVMFVSGSFTPEQKKKLGRGMLSCFCVYPLTADEVFAAAKKADVQRSVERSEDMLILSDKSGNIIFGCDKFLQKHPMAATLSDISFILADAVHTAAASGKPARFEAVIGSVWHEINLKRIRKNIIAIFARDITDRKMLEKSASMNEKRHMSLAVLGQMYEAEFEDILEYALDSAVEQSESTDGAISIVDKDGGPRLVALTAGGEKHLYSVQETQTSQQPNMSGVNAVLDSNEPYIDNASSVRTMIVPVMARGGVRMILTLSGKRTPYSMADATGLIHYMESVWRLKERKDAEEEINRLNTTLEQMIKERTNELVESENRFRTAFESTSNGMALIAVSGTILQANKALATMLGYRPEDMNGRSIYRFMNKEYAEASRNNLILMIKGEKDSYSAIKKYRHRDGSYKILSDSSAMARNTDGRPLYMVSQFVDVTEAERTRAERDRIFEHSHDIICVASFNGELRYANKVFEKLFGHITDKKHKPNLKDIFSKTEVEKARSFLAKMLSGSNIIDYETEHTSAAGEQIWLSWFASADNENRLVYAIARNITERKKYETSLKKARDEAQRANLAKSGFIANISHEIRTPLNAVIGFSELLAARVTDEKSKSFANSIKSGGKTLLNLINDILDISKLEAGAVKPVTTPTDIRYLMREIVNLFSVKAFTKSIKVTGHTDQDVPRFLLLDVSRIRQILLNLAGNAVKFTDKGFVNIKISVMKNPAGTVNLSISVEDSGIGIPESEYETIFEPFRQRDEKTMKAYGGTGLGLSISRKLAEIMGGRITLKSVMGKGSTFSLLLPDVAVCEENTRRIPSLRSIKFSPAKVLIVDDDEMSRNMLKEMLESCGLFVMEAQNGSSAQLIVKEAMPELIFMDIRMPDMDGYATARALRSDTETADIPIIAVTAAMEENNRDGLFNDFLYKPADMDVITACIAKYLKISYVRRPPLAGSKPSMEKLVKAAIEDGMPQEIAAMAAKAPKAVDMAQCQQICERMKYAGGKTKKLADEMQKYIDGFDIDKLRQLLDTLRKYSETRSE